MPPEQKRGEVDERSDIFALGGMLNAILTLQPPLQESDPEEKLEMPARPLPHHDGGRVPAALAAVCHQALAPDPARRYHSVALEADGQHLMTDVWTSVAAVAGLLLVKLTGWPWLDPALGLLLACHIVFTGVKLVHQSMLGLMDTGLPPEDLARIKAVLASYEAKGLHWHALRTREAGARRFMSLHLLVPGEWTVQRGHDVAEEVEAALRAAVDRLHVTTHLEPIEDPASFHDATLDGFIPP
jgi:cation diffusion facilitator family transporter